MNCAGLHRFPQILEFGEDVYHHMIRIFNEDANEGSMEILNVMNCLLWGSFREVHAMMFIEMNFFGC